MGNSSVVVFVFFGEQYLEQFKVCAETIPKHWNVKIITDCKGSNLGNSFEWIKVPTPDSVYKMLTFRKNIDLFVDINKYDQVWYFDCDMLFKGDILEKYKELSRIMVSFEPEGDWYHPCFSGGFNELELMGLSGNDALCINGGMFAVPKHKYYFFDLYRETIAKLEKELPENKSIDQFALNHLFHRKIIKMSNFPLTDIGFLGKGGFKLVNHYIGMGNDKVQLMKDELKRLQNDL